MNSIVSSAKQCTAILGFVSLAVLGGCGKQAPSSENQSKGPQIEAASPTPKAPAPPGISGGTLSQKSTTTVKVGQTYFNPETGDKLSVISEDEIELQLRGANVICKYTIQKGELGESKIRIIATIMGTTQALYYDVANGQLESDTQCYILADSMKEARANFHGTRASKCVAYAKQVWLACKLYADDHNGIFPPNFGDLCPEYTQSDQIFKSPYGPPQKVDYSSNTKAEPYKALKDFVRNSTDYQYFGGTLRDAPNKILLRCKYPSSDGRRTVVYVNGFAERIVQ